MKNKVVLGLFPVLASILALAILHFCLAVDTAGESAPPSGGPSSQTKPGMNPQGPSPQDELAMTRWISSAGDQPITFAEWQAQQPPPPRLQVERVYASPVLTEQVVYALVNPTIYDGISASLARWAADVEGEGWTALIASASFPDPPALRAHLASIPNLKGCLLIGDFPVPWYEWTDKQFPFEVFYMDLDGVWTDGDADGLYDEHAGDVAPEIWIGRLLASNLDLSGDEVSLLNNYLAKNHAYRTGSLSLPSRALVYIDDDWAYSADGLHQSMTLLYSDTTVIADPNTTRAGDYARRLTDYYAWIHVLAHSSMRQHFFEIDGGAITDGIFNDDIRQIDPHTFFYNLFACGAARFVERNYLSGWYVFADTYGLLTIGSTSGGSMVRGFDLFYGLLAEGMPLGQAFRDWFAVEGVIDQGWHYGLTLHGDPTLVVTTEEQVSDPPSSVTLTGPTTGDVGSSYTFTATIDPLTATQPLVYVWQASGQLSVTHKSGLSDSVAFNWWNTPGTKNITVTARNYAGIGTATHVTTVAAPEIQFNPSSYDATLGLGGLLTRSLTISNAGQGELAFHLAEADREPVPGSAPDPFGYTYKDSAEAAGPTYQWIEIAPPAGGVGTPVVLPTDRNGGYYWPIRLPFTFDFYGREYTHVAIGSRGTLNFRDRFIDRDNAPLPGVRALGEETFIASFWDYLVIDPGAVYYQALDGMFIVEYYQVSYYFGSGNGTWEIILFENGNILFQYQDVDFDYFWADQGRSATVGIQGDAITGLQYSYITAALSNGLAICFAYPGQLPDCSAYQDVPWLSETPTAGAVGAGDTQTVQLLFDAGVPEVTGTGLYRSAFVAVTNDPQANLVMVPVTMTVVSPTYGLRLAPTREARSGDPGTTVTYTLVVTNDGNTFDTFDVTAHGHTWSLDAASAIGPLQNGAGANLVVTVDIPAGAAGGAIDGGTVTVNSRADDAQWATATLSTTANALCSVVARPATDQRSAEPGATISHTLQVTNTGNVTDTFDVTISDYTWPAFAPGTVGPLAAGGSARLEVRVRIPLQATAGMTDTATVGVTSQADGSQSANASLVTQVAFYDLFLPLVLK